MDNRIIINSGTINLAGFEKISEFPCIRFSFPGENSFYISGYPESSEKSDLHYDVTYEKTENGFTVDDEKLAGMLKEKNAEKKIFDYYNNAYFPM